MPELLCLGQIHDSSAPSSAAAEVYYKSNNGYGSSYGTNDVTMVFETQDFPPMGPIGRCIARRFHVTIEHGGAISVTITPITDFNDEQPSHSFTLNESDLGRRREVLDVPMAKACTYVRCKIEVTSRTGLFYLHGVRLAFRPLTESYEEVAGSDG